MPLLPCHHRGTTRHTPRQHHISSSRPTPINIFRCIVISYSCTCTGTWSVLLIVATGRFLRCPVPLPDCSGGLMLTVLRWWPSSKATYTYEPSLSTRLLVISVTFVTAAVLPLLLFKGCCFVCRLFVAPWVPRLTPLVQVYIRS